MPNTNTIKIISLKQHEEQPKKRLRYKRRLKSLVNRKKYTSGQINAFYKKIVKETRIIPQSTFLDEFRKIYTSKNIIDTISFINKINHNQLVLLLLSLNLIEKRKSHAPTSLLRNILYNFITSTINIIS